MKRINLRYIYPYYTEDQYVVVSDEVANLIKESENAEKNSARRDRRYRADVVFDYLWFTEDKTECVVPSVADECERHEIQKELFDALDSITVSQAKRIVAHYIQKKTCLEIAREEGVNKQAVNASIRRGMKRLRKILISPQRPVDKSVIFDLYNERTSSFRIET